MSDTPIFDPNAPFTVEGEKSVDFDPNAPFTVEEATTSEGIVQEFAEGVASGGTKLVQGVLETAALVPDYFGGTDYASDITESFEEMRANLGIDPEGLAGAIGEVGVQFVVPGLAAARFVGAASSGCYQRYDYTRRFF